MTGRLFRLNGALHTMWGLLKVIRPDGNIGRWMQTARVGETYTLPWGVQIRREA